MKQNFMNTVKLFRPKKSVFDLSHEHKLSFNPGFIIPVYCQKVVPGEKFNISLDSLLRFQPLVNPVMHSASVTFHCWFVATRTLWPGFEDWITNTKTGGVLPAFPTLDITQSNLDNFPLLKYMGMPDSIGANDPTRVSAVPFAGYQAIINRYYRDENLQAEIPFELINGDNDVNKSNLIPLRRRCWERDYFTSCLPFAQKGDAVDIPLGTVEIELDPDWETITIGARPQFQSEAGSTTLGVLDQTNTPEVMINTAGSDLAQAYDPMGSLTGETQPTTINDLRLAFALQKWLEKNARGGTRMSEMIQAHFAETPQDFRLQDPEYITGTKSPVVISEVLNTTGTTELPQGNMSGHAVSVTEGGYGSYRTKEWGYIFCLMSVMPSTAYQDGIPRHFLEFTEPTEELWPDFVNLGEQAVINREVYAAGNSDIDGTFGYQPRYAQYRTNLNRVSGQFRSTLKTWQWGRIFDTQPALNDEFVSCVPRTDIFAVEDAAEDKMLAHIFFKIKALRPLPKFGTPTF